MAVGGRAPARPAAVQRLLNGETLAQAEQAGSGPSRPGDAGTEPDARFTLANERTFLAWSRTALALVIGGLAIAQLLPPFPGLPWGRRLIAVPLIMLGGSVSAVSYLEWHRNQQSLRHGRPMRQTRLPLIVAIAVAAIAVVATVLILATR